MTDTADTAAADTTDPIVDALLQRITEIEQHIAAEMATLDRHRAAFAALTGTALTFRQSPVSGTWLRDRWWDIVSPDAATSAGTGTTTSASPQLPAGGVVVGSEPLTDETPSLPDPPACEAALAEAVPSPAPRREPADPARKPGRQSKYDLEKVAEIYRAADVGKTAAAIAAHFNVSSKMAAFLIAKARKAGHIPPSLKAQTAGVPELVERLTSNLAPTPAPDAPTPEPVDPPAPRRPPATPTTIRPGLALCCDDCDYTADAFGPMATHTLSEHGRSPRKRERAPRNPAEA